MRKIEYQFARPPATGGSKFLLLPFLVLVASVVFTLLGTLRSSLSFTATLFPTIPVDANIDLPTKRLWPKTNQNHHLPPNQHLHHRQHQNNHSYPFTIGACLLTKDDNQLLPEWLAYHYTVLPLRHLIVATDPQSLTSPEQLFDTYRRFTDLKIDLWTNQTTYFVDGPRFDEKLANFNPSNHTTEQRFAIYFRRQVSFYTACLRHYKTRTNITWVILFDSDEYITFNKKFRDEEPTKRPFGPVRSSLPRQKIGRQNETIAHYIANNMAFRETTKDTKCRVFPRINFMALQEVNDTDLKESVPSESLRVSSTATTPSKNSSMLINGRMFHTLRFRSHGWLPYRKFPGKSMVNLANLNGNTLLVQDPHRPFRHACDNKVFGSVLDDVPFRFHHYTGSLETFVSRPERNKEGWFLRNLASSIHGQDDSLSEWFLEFCKLVGGVDVAYQLTQHAREEAYLESMDIKRRIEVNHEDIPPVFVW